MVVYSKPYLKIEIDEESKMMIQTWSGFATSEQFREDVENSLEIYRKQKPAKLLMNLRDSGVVKKEDTDWVANYAVPVMVKNGMKAQAFILPTSIFGQMSLTNFKSRIDAFNLTIQYFDDEKKAKEWLMTHS